ncbi:MAG: hypothetical protein A2X94_10500 [Bdellovibrionales bacterium GWB1_55_8]|nr:MAG: hypothetical protein A2X94_10500 [Bdellovibrionales bacterium GWB1_55_8]
MPKALAALLLSSAVFACSPGSHRRVAALGEILPSATPAAQESVVLVVGANPTPKTLVRARALGIRFTKGEAVHHLQGPVAALQELEMEISDNAFAVWDVPLRLSVGQADVKKVEVAKGVASPPYVAGREFGLESFFSSCRECDGRGVRAGVLDDGVSPVLSGFQTNPDGGRKFLLKGSTSSLLRFQLHGLTETEALNPFLAGAAASLRNVEASWTGEIVEPLLKPLRGERKLDLNFDGKLGPITLAVFDCGGIHHVCIDSNANRAFDQGECQGVFSKTGHFGWWNHARQLEWTAEFDPVTAIVSLTEGERGGIAETHGEGVASVLLGYGIGGRWNGVAPGAQLLDYDIWSPSDIPGETLYTMGQFLTALEWFGRNSAEVVNISYSLHFSNPEAQVFMRAALDALVRRFGFVLAFSAGNDGPGVGSFHRAGIFPKNVIVSGAYLSRELAENVNGETDVPEGGRVTYYSSRGPGPDGGSAPTLVAPVSSLVHRTPGGGYTSFSGTSSSSPAAAGLAAVLISAVKREQLVVSPAAIVHALRLSAKPIPDAPFIDQGYGVPEITRALAIYRELITGRIFAYVDAEIVNRKGADGIPATGWVIRSSERRAKAAGRLEARVKLQGVAAVAGISTSELIRPVVIEYSHSWLNGPARLWLARSASSFSLEVNLADARFPEPGGELNGEVRILDQETRHLLHVIPVTLMDDMPLEGVQERAVDLGTEEGVRLHFNAAPGLAGIRVRTNLQNELEGYVELKVFDPSGKMTFGPRIKGGESDALVPIERTGPHQLAFYRVKGVRRKFRLAFQLEPVKVSLLSRFLNLKEQSPELRLQQLGPTQDFMLDLFHENEIAKSEFVLPDVKGEYSISLTSVDSMAVEYSLETEPAEYTDVSDFVPDCYWTRIDDFEDPVRQDLGHGMAVKLPANFRGTIRFACRSFEHLGKKWQTSAWKMSLLKKTAGRSFLGRKTWVRLVPGLNRIRLESGASVNPGSRLGVWLRPVFGSGFIRAGVVESY